MSDPGPLNLLLYGYVASNREQMLRQYLTTEWTLTALRDTSDRDVARNLVADADAMVAQAFEPDLTDAAGRLKLIHVHGAGVDRFKPDDLPIGCVLCNCYEHEAPIAEYVMLNVLLHVTQQNRFAESMRRGDWDGSGRHDGVFHDEAMGKTLGLIGFGHIGREVARRAKALAMRVIAVRRRPQQSADEADLDWCGAVEELPRLLRESDFVVLALPQNASSVGLLGAAELAMMKPTAVLINPARGPIVDEKALFAALKERRIAAAALDAQYCYPPDLSEPMLGWHEPFHELDNVILTPHYSAWTQQMVSRRCQRIADNLDRLHRGQPLVNVVVDRRVV